MKFGIIKFAPDAESMAVPGVLAQMPRGIKELFIRLRAPCGVKELILSGAEGYEFILPLLKSELEDIGKVSAVMEKVSKRLSRMNVGIVVCPDELYFRWEYKTATGRGILPFFAKAAMLYAAKLHNLPVAEIRVLIIDGEGTVPETVISSLAEKVNYLSVYTDRKTLLAPLAEEIYEEWGLNVSLFSSPANPFLREADIIVNCGMDLENNDYFFKTGAIYIDVNKNTQKIKRIARKRDDMRLADSLLLARDGLVFPAEYIEAAEYAINPGFRKFLDGDCSRLDVRRQAEYFAGSGYKVAGFMISGK